MKIHYDIDSILERAKNSFDVHLQIIGALPRDELWGVCRKPEYLYNQEWVNLGLYQIELGVRNCVSGILDNPDYSFIVNGSNALEVIKECRLRLAIRDLKKILKKYGFPYFTEDSSYPDNIESLCEDHEGGLGEGKALEFRKELEGLDRIYCYSADSLDNVDTNGVAMDLGVEYVKENIEVYRRRKLTNRDM
ncbi:hypothetical protein [Cerasicoccus fimbriatus]|uniref:hypothetical protein n=1 Tax=Cerasicoccus fimbriatus TaxID=3014554 RepID=UPI0022B3F774|nr:hypothetical protein [Cerasicoccus sp. TK19100]